MRFAVCIYSTLAMALFIAPASALVPLTTPIQGVLRDGAGVPVADAHFGMTFTLYTGPGQTADAVWSEAWPPDGADCLVDTEGCVHVTGGHFRVLLGEHAPLSPEVFAVGPLWLGVQVEQEPELPRRPLGSSPYAHRAAVAGSLDCTGCVNLDAVSDGARQALLDDALSAVSDAGYPTAEDLETLDLEQISNGTLTNAFTHVADAPESVPILDVNPGGVGSHVVTPDLGIIEAARVRAHVTNSDLSTLKFQLFTLDQETGTILLYDKSLEGTELETTWPTEMAPVAGTFDTLVGKSTDGVWVFHVTDEGSSTGEGLSPKDGAIVSWSLELDVAGGNQVIVQGQAVVNGDLQVEGDTTMEGDAQVKGDLEVGGVLSGPGGILVGAGAPTCDPEHAGAIHYDPQVQRLVFCDGQKLLQLRACEALCPDPASAPCGEGLIDGCGGACEGTGSGLSAALCISEQPATACGGPVLDPCGNTCGSEGTGPDPSGCPSESDVACGQSVLDACGHPCGSSGTALDVGQCPAPGDVPCDTAPLDPCGNTCPGQVVPCAPPFEAVTFSTCGQSGLSGPSQSDCSLHYVDTPLEGSVTVIDGIQRWTAPHSATYRVRAIGASGGGASAYVTSFRGRGVTLEGDFLLNEGQVLSILVGQEGEDGENIGGGGGGSFVVYDQTSTALVVGGGGGGACGPYNHRSGGPLGGGGADATLSETGQTAPYEESSYPPGQGGTNGNGGGMTSGGCGTGGGGGLFSDGVTGQGSHTGSQGGKAFINGGAGTPKSTADAGDGGFGGGSGGNNQCLTSAGAGGGYSGGGGGGHNAGGGGGGSYNNGGNQANTGQTNLGHGQVVISLVE